MTPWGAVILQTQKPYRRGEYAACMQFYLDAEIPIYDLITAGNVEGGDFMVLKPGDCRMRILGRTLHRTGGAAAQELVRGRRVGDAYLCVRPALSAPRRADGHARGGTRRGVCRGRRARARRLARIEGDPRHRRPYSDAMQLGTNVVALGDERVLVPASSKNLIAACRAEGLTVYAPDVSMIANGGGAVHCMCQALKRDRTSLDSHSSGDRG